MGLILFAFSTFFGAILPWLLYKIAHIEMAARKLKEKSPHLPQAKRNILNGNMDFNYKENNFRMVHELHAKLGTTFAFFRNHQPAVSTCDLDLIKRVAVDEADKHPNRGGIGLILEEVTEDSIAYVDGDQWRRIRKAYAPALSARKIKSVNVQTELNSVLDRHLEALAKRLDESTQAEVKLDDFSAELSLDVVFTTLFKAPDAIKESAEFWVEGLEKSVRALVGPIFVLGLTFPDLLSEPLNWLAKHFSPLSAFREGLVGFVKKHTRDHFAARLEASRKKLDFEKLDELRLEDGSSFRRSLADFVTDRLHDGTLTKREHLHSTFSLFIAAGKTTADAVLLLLFNLAAHPEAQEKARASVLSAGAESEYLGWCINETLRLTPPVPVGCTRRISQDVFTSAGQFVPAGSYLFTPAYTIHRLQKYWGRDAEEFRPERWAEAKSFHPCQFLGFGAGKRNCPGAKLALEVLRQLLDSLLKSYKIERSAKSDHVDINSAPFHSFFVFNKPTYVKFSRLQQANQ